MQKIKKAEPRSTVPLSSLFLYLLHPQNPTLKINPPHNIRSEIERRHHQPYGLVLRRYIQLWSPTIWFGPSAIHTTMASQSESFSGSEGDDGTAKELEEKIKSDTTTAGK